MRFLPSDRVLKIINVVVLVGILLCAVDAYVRWRVGQAISGYHAGVIEPLIKPRPTSGTAQPGKP